MRHRYFFFCFVLLLPLISCQSRNEVDKIRFKKSLPNGITAEITEIVYPAKSKMPYLPMGLDPRTTHFLDRYDSKIYLTNVPEGSSFRITSGQNSSYGVSGKGAARDISYNAMLKQSPILFGLTKITSSQIENLDIGIASEPYTEVVWHVTRGKVGEPSKIVPFAINLDGIESSFNSKISSALCNDIVVVGEKGTVNTKYDIKFDVYKNNGEKILFHYPCKYFADASSSKEQVGFEQEDTGRRTILADDIKEIRGRFRPYEYIHFTNIPLPKVTHEN
jgi:hypothetical protein